MRKLEAIRPPDVWILTTTLLLLGAGLLLVFDAGYGRLAENGQGDVWHEVKRQLVFAAIGLAGMLAASRVRLQTYLRLTVPLLAISFVLLVAVMLVGAEVNGACRWIALGGINIQPSELAKIALVLYLAGVIAQRKTRVRRLTTGSVVPVLVVGVFSLMIVIQPDLGTALTIVGAAFVVLFVGGARKSHLLTAAGFGAALVLLAIKLEPYRMGRIRTFFRPWDDPYGEGYQVIHSLTALGTGGLVGLGLCQGREKLYLFAASTDFIFATIGEEAGLLGCLALMGIYGALTWRGFVIARRCKSTYGNLVGAGITGLISLQALTNIAVVSASVPATGIPLPFISYGGSSLISSLVAVGILLAVSRQADVVIDERDLYENSIDGWRDRRTYLPRHQHRSGAAKSGRSGTAVRGQLSRTGGTSRR